MLPLNSCGFSTTRTHTNKVDASDQSKIAVIVFVCVRAVCARHCAWNIKLKPMNVHRDKCVCVVYIVICTGARSISMNAYTASIFTSTEKPNTCAPNPTKSKCLSRSRAPRANRYTHTETYRTILAMVLLCQHTNTRTQTHTQTRQHVRQQSINFNCCAFNSRARAL